MIYRDQEYIDLPTPSGPMRTHLFSPVSEGRYPGVILYSEIFQATAPIRRTAAYLAGHGFFVAVPEIYHEYEPAGTVLAYDQAGADRGNELKYTKTLVQYDGDAAALVDFFKKEPRCSGEVGAMGICLGGHLSYRACVTQPELKVGICYYGTDLHHHTLGAGKNDDTLARSAEIQAEMLMVWGRQDPHIPSAGRRLIYDQMENAALTFTWHEFNGQHAFMRDEGHRHDPEVSHLVWSLTLATLRRRLMSHR
jgi:carboxymethylenebutenolidase